MGAFTSTAIAAAEVLVAAEVLLVPLVVVALHRCTTGWQLKKLCTF